MRKEIFIDAENFLDDLRSIRLVLRNEYDTIYASRALLFAYLRLDQIVGEIEDVAAYLGPTSVGEAVLSEEAGLGEDECG